MFSNTTTPSPAQHAAEQTRAAAELTERFHKVSAERTAALSKLPKDGSAPDLGLALGLDALADAKADIRAEATEAGFRLVAVRGHRRFLPTAEAAAVEAAQDAVRDASTLPRRTAEWTPEQFAEAAAVNAARRNDLEALYFRLGL